MQRRGNAHDSSSMSGILAPDARKPPPKNFHRENIQAMHNREQEIQRKREQDAQQQNSQQPQWKMNRFKSVESKVRPAIGGAQGSAPSHIQPENTSVGQPERKMTKAEAMKLRMQQERAGIGGPTASTSVPNQQIQMEQPRQQQQRRPPMPMQNKSKTNRMAEQQMPTESIYNIAPEQPRVVQYTSDQMSVPEPPRQVAPQRRPPVPTVQPRMARASSVGNNRAAQNAGSQILASGSQKNMATKEAVPRADQISKLKRPDQQQNYVKNNMNKAIFEMQPPAPKNQEDANVAGPNKNYGKVPSYINKYKNQREDEIKQKAFEEEMSRHPPGTRLMPESERQDTLKDLKEAREETNKQLERLPIVSHSQKGERHKKELEEKLQRLEKAIETFSKPTVYVAM